MSKTEDNLKEAFAGESQANRKYLAFAAKDLTITAAEIAALPLARIEAGRPLPLKEGVNLFGRLHIARAVMVEADGQPRGLAHRARDGLHALGEEGPARVAQAHSRRHAPGVFRALGNAAVVIGEDDHRRMVGRRRTGQQPGHTHGRFRAGRMRGLAAKTDGHESADHGNPARLQHGAQRGGFGGHEAPIAELGAAVTRFGQFVEHALAGERLAAQPFEFQAAPGAGRISDANRSHKNHPLGPNLSRRHCPPRHCEEGSSPTWQPLETTTRHPGQREQEIASLRSQ